MAWSFPQDRPFDVVTKGAQYLNCRFVAILDGDGGHLVVDRDYVCVLGRMHRIRTQVAIEDIEAVHEHAVTGAREHANANEVEGYAALHGALQDPSGEGAGEMPAA